MESRPCRLSYFKAVVQSHLDLRVDNFPNLLVKAPYVEGHLWATQPQPLFCPRELASQSLCPPLCRLGNAQVCGCQSD